MLTPPLESADPDLQRDSNPDPSQANSVLVSSRDKNIFPLPALCSNKRVRYKEQKDEEKKILINETELNWGSRQCFGSGVTESGSGIFC
jgi:hypothetical protein